MERGFALGKKTKTMRLNMQRDGEWEKLNQKNMRQGLSTEESIEYAMAAKNTSKSESEDKTREVIDTLEGVRKGIRTW